MVDGGGSSNTQALIRVTTVHPTTQGNMSWIQRDSRKVANVRISGFPSSYNAEQVHAYLRERVIEGGGSGVDVHLLTVASDVIFDDYGVAVASFFDLPPELPIPGSLGDMWFADTAFHGLTTLYSPADGKATVE